MKYLLLIYQRPGSIEGLTDAERDAIFADVDELMAELTASGEWVGGEGLADPASARSIRLEGGQVVVSDGPFLESKEHFAGYCAVDVESIERAVEIASRWPDVRLGGTMEVRAVAPPPDDG